MRWDGGEERQGGPGAANDYGLWGRSLSDVHGFKAC